MSDNKEEQDKKTLERIKFLLNPETNTKNININDGDELAAVYGINNGKKAKNSLTARSRMNRNIHTSFQHLKDDLDDYNKKHNKWWGDNDT